MTGLEVFWERCEGPVSFGANDCCMTIADVILAEGGPDLMEGYRGRYTTRRGYLRAIHREGHGSVAAAAEAMLARVGTPVSVPCNFDVAVASYLADGKVVQSPAFFHGGFWCLRSDAGMFAAQGEPSTIYRVL